VACAIPVGRAQCSGTKDAGSQSASKSHIFVSSIELNALSLQYTNNSLKRSSFALMQWYSLAAMNKNEKI